MARQPLKRSDETEDVQSISNTPVEPMPEQSGSMTAALADAMKPAEPKGSAKALQQPPKANAQVRYYRVLADRYFMGASGFRAKMRAGKEISSVHYNIRQLQQQGVQLEEIEAPAQLAV